MGIAKTKKTVGEKLKYDIMLIAAGIIYLIFAFINGPLWPLELLSGKAALLGYLLVIIWLGLLIGGFVS